jgi:hypothetical protein
MTEQLPAFFLIIADHDQGFFCVEGPMTDDRPWKDAAMNARNNQRRIECGPADPDRDALAPTTNAPTDSAAFRRAASSDRADDRATPPAVIDRRLSPSARTRRIRCRR